MHHTAAPFPKHAVFVSMAGAESGEIVVFTRNRSRGRVEVQGNRIQLIAVARCSSLHAILQLQ